MTKAQVNDPTLKNVLWSDVEYRLSEFVDRFTLPQLVKVQEGFYGPDEDSCIGAEQILTLHAIKTTEKLLARDWKNRELHIPLNCSQKVELRPHYFRGVYETVEELTQFKFLRVTQGYYSLEDESCSVNPGDKLEVIRVEKGIGIKEDCILFQNQDRSPIRLPFSAGAGFQPLIDGREYYLKEMSIMKLPIYFQFIDPPKPIGSRRAENVFNSSLGVLKLEQAYQDSSVICTTKVGSVRTVVTCPKELPITVIVAQGALEGDKDYVRLCRLFHEGVSLTKIDNMELENMYASRSTIREYEYIDMPLPPPVPPRTSNSDDKSSPLSAKKNHPKASPSTKQRSITLESPPTSFSDDKPPKETPLGKACPPLKQRSNTVGPMNPEESGTSSITEASQQEKGKDDSDDDDNAYEYIDEDEIFPPSPSPKDVVSEAFQPGKDQSNELSTSHAASTQAAKTTTDDDDDSDEHNYVSIDDNETELPPSYSEHDKSKQPVPLYQVPNKPVKSNQEKLPTDKNGTQEPNTSPRKHPPPVKAKPVIRGPPPPMVAQASFDIPDDLSQLSIGEVSKFLKKVHLENSVDVFAENDVDGQMLVIMTAEDLRDLGMNAFQCKKLLKLISGWRPRL